jgi:DNA-binding HxlR family transcriptional regulator
LDNDVRELVVMLERDGLVRTVTNDATGPRVTITLTALGATRQRTGAAVQRALSALR